MLGVSSVNNGQAEAKPLWETARVSPEPLPQLTSPGSSRLGWDTPAHFCLGSWVWEFLSMIGSVPPFLNRSPHPNKVWGHQDQLRQDGHLAPCLSTRRQTSRTVNVPETFPTHTAVTRHRGAASNPCSAPHPTLPLCNVLQGSRNRLPGSPTQPSVMSLTKVQSTSTLPRNQMGYEEEHGSVRLPCSDRPCDGRHSSGQAETKRLLSHKRCFCHTS